MCKSNILEVRGLCKKYDSFMLKDINFNLERGSITGFIGKDGAGKSTTMKAILQLISIDSGEILYNGSNPKVKAIGLTWQCFIGKVISLHKIACLYF